MRLLLPHIGTGAVPAHPARIRVFTITITAPQQVPGIGARARIQAVVGPGTRDELQQHLQQGYQAWMQKAEFTRPREPIGKHVLHH